MRRSQILVPMLGLVLAGCGHDSSSSPSSSSSALGCCPPQQDARLVGHLVGIGGPAGAPHQHWAGTIHVTGTQSSTLRTDDRGRFTASLATGTYRLTATSPSYDDGNAECRASGPVRLQAHETTHVRVICQLK